MDELISAGGARNQVAEGAGQAQDPPQSGDVAPGALSVPHTTPSSQLFSRSTGSETDPFEGDSVATWRVKLLTIQWVMWPLCPFLVVILPGGFGDDVDVSMFMMLAAVGLFVLQLGIGILTHGAAERVDPPRISSSTAFFLVFYYGTVPIAALLSPGMNMRAGYLPSILESRLGLGAGSLDAPYVGAVALVVFSVLATLASAASDYLAAKRYAVTRSSEEESA
ncbi:MAG: hypothetical protein E7Z96_09630 [Actinomycetaceae bacterium]|nr:hypothetical protein [Actinomycetaceae bacterium]